MTEIITKPFYDVIADLSIEELKKHGKKAINNFRKSLKELEETDLRNLGLLEKHSQLISDAYTSFVPLYILDMAHTNKAYRDFGSNFTVEMEAELNKLSLNLKIYKKLKNNIDPSKLDDVAKYLYHEILDEYSRSGIDKPKSIRDEITKLLKEKSELSIKFARNINDSTPKAKFNKGDLEGCFDEFIKSNTNTKGEVEVTLVSSNIQHILQNCSVKSTREKVRELSLNASKGSNWDVLPAYLNKCEQIAKLIGFNNYAEISMQNKMIENPKKAKDFIESLLSLTNERVTIETKLIKEEKKRRGDNSDLTYADIDYYGNQIASKLSSLDEEAVKQYFPYEHVKESILGVFEELFTIKFVKNKTAKTWHKDVDVFDVFDNDRKIGIIYLDMHPRNNKYNHACFIDVIAGVKGKAIPQGVLLCNFNKPTSKSDGLQSLDEVSTFFHEFGHLIHGMLGGQNVKWLEFSGTNVQRDFVEAPSQLLEEMILSPQVLKKLSKHIDTKHQIPDNLIQSIRDKESVFDKAKLKGIGIARQASLSKQSLEVYLAEKVDNQTLTKIEHESSIEALGVYGDYYGIYDFGHITDYTSNYYTYMWSLAISKDLFTKFNKKNLLDKKVAQHYRKTILEPGGSKPAAELVKDFLGREWNMNAFKAYLKEGEELLEKI